MSETIRDIRYALRTIAKTPGLTAITVLTLALGLGSTTVVFSVVNTVRLRPLPYASPDRLVRIVENIPPEENQGERERSTGLNVAELDWWRTNATTLSDIALMQRVSGKVTTAGGVVQLYGAEVSPALFAMRGVPPLLGRGLVPEEERPDADVVVLAEATWREHFGADPGVVGRRLAFADRSVTVVGVMPREFGADAFWAPFWAPNYIDAAAEEPWIAERPASRRRLARGGRRRDQYARPALARPHARAGRRSTFRAGARARRADAAHDPGAACARDGCRGRAADRLHERHELAARPRHRAPTGNQRSAARSAPRAPGSCGKCSPRAGCSRCSGVSAASRSRSAASSA